MRVHRPHIAQPLYDLLPWLYGLGGLVVLALSYLRLKGWLSGLLGLAGLAAVIWGLAIGLRRRDFRAMRHEYGGDGLPPRDQDGGAST
ncbi:MAG: hypothetical protein NAOJABEB_02231 [Steroidobacteraceae bacterium]|nr:hypothetical protein [Steroidobacteraceae bacterium]